jgi:hypothetical protein
MDTEAEQPIGGGGTPRIRRRWALVTGGGLAALAIALPVSGALAQGEDTPAQGQQGQGQETTPDRQNAPDRQGMPDRPCPDDQNGADQGQGSGQRQLRHPARRAVAGAVEPRSRPTSGVGRLLRPRPAEQRPYDWSMPTVIAPISPLRIVLALRRRRRRRAPEPAWR